MRILNYGLVALTAGMLASASAYADVTVSTKPTANMSCTGGVCTPTAKKAVLNVTDLANMLASGDVTVQSGSVAQDIEIDAALSWTSTQRLTLDSYHSIEFQKPVTVAGVGGLTITTNDGGSGGDFSFEDKGCVQFWDWTSPLTINGQFYRLYTNFNELRKDLRHGGGSAHYALAKNINSKQSYTTSPFPNFNGTFEGLGNTISNLTIANQANTTGVGLFEGLGGDSIIRDINLARVNVVGTGMQNAVGAVVGSNIAGTILNAHVNGTVSASNTGSIVGGLVGDNELGLIAGSSSTANIVGAAGVKSVGGLIGFNYEFELDRDYATGTINDGDDGIGGGLVGENLGGTVSNSYANVAVTGGNDAVVGGLVGENAAEGSNDPIIDSSYSTGSVTGGSGATVGGLIGSDVAAAQTANAYWDMDTSGISDPSNGAGNITNDPGIKGLSDAQLKSGLPAGFDKKVWKENAAINNGYPYLIANPPPK